MKFKGKLQDQKGITLVALIITIIVLVILAAVSISAVYNSKIVGHAVNGATGYSNEALNENKIMEKTENLIESTVDEIYAILGKSGAEDIPPREEPPTEPQVTLADGTVITKSNVAGYLGKKVTNYTGQSSINVDGTDYTVSPTYRLYYVDFDNKYGDGKGTIYLKAECTGNGYPLPVTDASSDTDTNIKIRALNPSLYAEGVTPPTASNENMKAVTWLTNTSKWAGLKTSDEALASKVNYIVGSPSLEMMMDSYNTHYANVLDNPDATEPVASGERSSSSTRTKLFYNYTEGDTGYKVGPGKTSAWNTWTDGYYTVQPDSEIDTMYYPGSSQYYWLASPSASGAYNVMFVSFSDGGSVHRDSYSSNNAFCPLVSLKSDAQLSLQ